MQRFEQRLERSGRQRQRRVLGFVSMEGLDAGLPATWEIISAMAGAPEPGAPIREGGADLAAVPVSRIPIRRRG